MKFYTADRETGNFIDEFTTIDEARKAIKRYEQTDIDNDCFEPDFYDIVNEFHETIKYIVFWVGGNRDGEILKTFDMLNDAIKFADSFWKDHESEFDPMSGGVGINDVFNPDNIVEW